VRAAQDVLYGADPKAKTAARQLAVYGGLRRSHFDSLDPQEQSTLLGDLSYIATTSKGPNAGRAQTLIDRFTPPGTPAGTMPKQAIIPPASAVAAQMRVADPTGTPGLLAMLPTSQRGLSGDGWTRTASGGTGPWGQYGAAGLMLRHVDANGEERFLMVERGPGISDPGKWQFPGGAKEEKESFYEGAAREVIEELGFKPSDLDGARVHGTHTNEVPSVKVPGLHGGTVPWAYVSVVATVPTQLTPDLSTHHARMETSDAKWMTAAEIRQLDTGGKLLRPLAGGQLEQNVMSLFPTTAGRGAGRPAPRTTRPNRLVPGASSKLAHKPSRGVDLIGTKASKDKLRQDVKQARKRYAGKVADDRLAAIGAMQGYDETPTVVSKADFDRLLATGDYTEAWRGVRGAGSSRLPGGARGGGTVSRTKTAAEVNEDMRSGIAYYGTGVFGNGYYLAEQKSVAAGYTDGTKNSLVRVLIPKSANVVDHADARKGASGASTARSKAKGSSYEDGTLYDEGRYAAAKGFAGIRITHTSQMRHGGSASHIASPKSPAWNWLDRSTLIVQEAEA
jgi:8-oxo-dGTP pyrophosphatase MutT (NUDIX family)